MTIFKTIEAPFYPMKKKDLEASLRKVIQSCQAEKIPEDPIPFTSSVVNRGGDQLPTRAATRAIDADELGV